ncbi:hypothetical protein L9F63_016085, partial [Diploptera punctata]
MKFLVVLAAAVACSLAKPGGLLAPGITAYHGLGPIAPIAAPYAAHWGGAIAAPWAAPIAAPLAAPIHAPVAVAH